MLPRGLQSSQSFNRSCARLLIARHATTPSFAFSTSPTRCITRARRPLWDETDWPSATPSRPSRRSSLETRAKRQAFVDGNERDDIKPLIRHQQATSPQRVPLRYVRVGGAPVAPQRATDEEEKTESEEVYPTRGELQAWFQQFMAERSIPEAPPEKPPRMRVRKKFILDKVQDEEEIVKLEDMIFSSPAERKKRRGTVRSTTSGEFGKHIDARASSVHMAEKKAGEQSNTDDGPAIIVLNSVSRSLVESDFRYLAGHGQLVDGWTYGLVKVVQSRSRLTHEPQGCYFLFFDTEPNARAYINILKRLHDKSRLRLPKEWQPKSTDKPESTDMNDWLGDYLKARSYPDDDPLDADSYTLLPPTTPLYYQIFTRHNILEYENIREAKKGLRPQQILSPPNGGRSAQKVPEPPKDLVHYAQNPPTEHSRTKVLVYLVGSKLTTRALRTAIEMDAEARNYPWQLVQEEEDTAMTTTTATKKTTEELLGKGDTDPAIKPVMSTLSIIKFSKFNDHRIEHEVDQFSGGKVDEGEMHGFSRFVVSFADVTEARRFVRAWHKREIVDPRTERMVQFNVTALW